MVSESRLYCHFQFQYHLTIYTIVSLSSHIERIEGGREPFPRIAGVGRIFESIAFTFVEKSINSTGPEPADPSQDGGLAGVSKLGTDS